MAMKESDEKCPCCKGKVQFLYSSTKLISQLTGAPSRDDVSSCGLQNPKSGDTNSEQYTCISAIYVKVVTLEPANTHKQANKFFLSNTICKKSGHTYIPDVPIQFSVPLLWNIKTKTIYQEHQVLLQVVLLQHQQPPLQRSQLPLQRRKPPPQRQQSQPQRHQLLPHLLL